jgi:hypothetical protein
MQTVLFHVLALIRFGAIALIPMATKWLCLSRWEFHFLTKQAHSLSHNLTFALAEMPCFLMRCELQSPAWSFLSLKKVPSILPCCLLASLASEADHIHLGILKVMQGATALLNSLSLELKTRARVASA